MNATSNTRLDNANAKNKQKKIYTANRQFVFRRPCFVHRLASWKPDNMLFYLF